jgi:hypothetical protein
MDDYTLTRQEMVLLGAAILVFILVPSWFVIFRNRRAAKLSGYRPAGHGYSAFAVLVCLVPLAGMLLTWFLLSAGLLGMFHGRLPANLMEGMPWMLFIADLAALVLSLQVCMPAPYMEHMQSTPKGMHGPLDWLVGFTLAAIFFPATLLQIVYVLGLGA